MKEDYPFNEAAEIMKTIAHPVRLSILLLLEKGKLNVRDIQSAIKAKQPITSQHLIAMSGKGILSRERKGNEIFYSIHKKAVLRILSCIKGCCRGKGEGE